MKAAALDENTIRDIGHAFGYYDYGTEHGLIDAFPSREAVASFICGYAKMALQSGMLYATSEAGEGFIAYKLPGEKITLKAGLYLARLPQRYGFKITCPLYPDHVKGWFGARQTARQGKETVYLRRYGLRQRAVSRTGVYASGHGYGLCRGKQARCAGDTRHRCKIKMR